jgi:carboxylesterase type B
MVWIYGGAFLHGSSSRVPYLGDKLAIKGCGSVIVSFNYRVGALGFLVSSSDGLFGNYGLHDQKLAMQWVQDHIASFGGDPKRVTLFGESAGAMSIGLHYIEQQQKETTSSQQLFHRIILQSNPLGYK